MSVSCEWYLVSCENSQQLQLHPVISKIPGECLRCSVLLMFGSLFLILLWLWKAKGTQKLPSESMLLSLAKTYLLARQFLNRSNSTSRHDPSGTINSCVTMAFDAFDIFYKHSVFYVKQLFSVHTWRKGHHTVWTCLMVCILKHLRLEHSSPDQIPDWW